MGRYKGDDIYKDVLDAMQNAEEAGGPEGQDYCDLMRRIADEATARAETVDLVLKRKKLLAALADELFALRARFNLGDGDQGAPAHNVAAALLESFGSFVACVEDGESAIDALALSVAGDLENHGDPDDINAALTALAVECHAAEVK